MTSPGRPEIPQEDPYDEEGLEPPMPRTEMRQTALSVALTVVVAVVLVVAATGTAGLLHTVLILAAPGVILAGAVYAGVRAYGTYRRDGRWQVWQGGMWFLTMLLLLWGPSAVTFLIVSGSD
ncbi:hypothetical protein C6V83_05405 [Gordonia iterans]|uniref:Uncharacterized protein n=1 Tax=Gordonia iterans TaxID=1004901 RepID=A0A2S0KDT9_9ACTN|nr:hypothetical protein [Gordonia iterans]AVL99800.1 hypothetical protein C6V83_05405 [Gordonia iterans]